MDKGNHHRNPVKLVVFFLLVFLAITTFVVVHPFQVSGGGPSAVATYAHGLLHLTIPYNAAFNRAYTKDPKLGNPTQIYANLARAGGADFRDAWGTSLAFEPAGWDSTKQYYLVRSAGPDRQPNTADDMQAYLLFQRKWVVGPPNSERTLIAVNIEHDRGPFNGIAEIVGTVADPSGAVVAVARVEVRQVSSGKIRVARTNAAGEGIPPVRRACR